MQGISRVTRVAMVTLMIGGCFPPVDDKDADVSVDDVADTSGQDTSQAGDTSPQPETVGDDSVAPVDTVDQDTENDTIELDTVEPDTTVADTVEPDTSVVDTVEPDTLEVDTVEPECDDAGDCQHLAGVCTKVLCLGGTCAAQPDSGADCDDGVACTKDDVCSGFTCAGTAYGCDDGETCTDDLCDGDGGCDYPAKDGACWIAGQCFTAGDTKPGDPCRVCQSGESWSPNDGATCSDGDDVCTLEDTCDGMTCVPGDPPDDAPGNWAVDVVRSVSPQRSLAVAVQPVGLSDWAFFAELQSGGLVPTTTGDVNYSSDAMVVVRKSAASTWVMAEFTADQALLTASTAQNGVMAWGAQLQGPGEATFADETLTKSGPETSFYLAATDAWGDRRFLIETPWRVEAIATMAGGGVTTASVTHGSYVTSAGENATIPGTDISDVAVTRYSSLGEQLWGGVIRTPELPAALPSSCRVDGTAVGVIAAVRQSAAVEIGPSTIDVTVPGTNTTFAIIKFDGATTTTVVAPFEFTGELMANPGIAIRAPVLFCDSAGFVVIFDGVAPTAIDDSIVIVQPDAASAIVRVGWNGAPEWALELSGVPVLKSAYSAGTLTIVGTRFGGTGQLVRVGGPVLATLDSASQSVLHITGDGLLSWGTDLTNDVPSILGVGVRGIAPNLKTAVAGAYVGSGLDWTSVSPAFEFTGSSDVNAFGVLLNSASGLSCAP